MANKKKTTCVMSGGDKPIPREKLNEILYKLYSLFADQHGLVLTNFEVKWKGDEEA